MPTLVTKCTNVGRASDDEEESDSSAHNTNRNHKSQAWMPCKMVCHSKKIKNFAPSRRHKNDDADTSDKIAPTPEAHHEHGLNRRKGLKAKKIGSSSSLYRSKSHGA